jgi:metal-responsive CopG/Arc/MetJ family transcriptional regulator
MSRDKIHTELLGVRISPNLLEQLEAIASRRSMNKGEFVRYLIQTALDNDK